jgi:hypothetical protein
MSDLHDVSWRRITDGEGASNAEPEPTYKLTVTYALGHDQEHPGLTAEAVEQGFVAFFHDLTYLEGEGVQRIAVEIEGERNERGGFVPGLR